VTDDFQVDSSVLLFVSVAHERIKSKIQILKTT